MEGMKTWCLTTGLRGGPGCSPGPSLSPTATPAATMWNIFKKNQQPEAAPAATTATMPAGPVGNSTESEGAEGSKEDMFAKLKEKFFNEMNKIPCECPRGWVCVGGCWGTIGWLFPEPRFRLYYWGALPITGNVDWLIEGSRGVMWTNLSGKKVFIQFRKLKR